MVQSDPSARGGGGGSDEPLEPPLDPPLDLNTFMIDPIRCTILKQILISDISYIHNLNHK